jgi:quinol monooxygenase YgiN
MGVDGRIVLTGWIAFPSTERDELRPLLDEHIRLTRAEPGCLAFNVVESREDPTRLDVAETFRDRADFDAHQRRTAGSAWGAATSHLKRHYRVVEPM